jgi:hypothetical protein
VKIANRVRVNGFQRDGIFGAPEIFSSVRRTTQGSTMPPPAQICLSALAARRITRSRDLIRGVGVIDFCDPLQKLDMAGFLA